MPKVQSKDASSPEFKIFVVYENAKCFQRAVRLREAIARDSQGVVMVNFCCVDWLGMPTLCADASRSASKANIILFLGEISAAFPPRFTDWLRILPRSGARGVYGLAANPASIDMIDLYDLNVESGRMPIFGREAREIPKENILPAPILEHFGRENPTMAVNN